MKMGILDTLDRNNERKESVDALLTTRLLLGGRHGLAAATGALGVLAAHADAPVVAETTVRADLLEALEVLAELLLQRVRESLRVLARLVVFLSVEEPGRDLELLRVLDDSHELLDLIGGELACVLKRRAALPFSLNTQPRRGSHHHQGPREYGSSRYFGHFCDKGFLISVPVSCARSVAADTLARIAQHPTTPLFVQVVGFSRVSLAFLLVPRGTQGNRAGALVHVNGGLFAHDVGESTSDTRDRREREHSLAAAVNVGVEHTQNVLEIGGDNERHPGEWYL